MLDILSYFFTLILIISHLFKYSSNKNLKHQNSYINKMFFRKSSKIIENKWKTALKHNSNFCSEVSNEIPINNSK